MDTIITIEGQLLDDLLHDIRRDGLGVYRLRVARDGDTVKLKVNESTWTPGYPAAEEDLRRDADRVDAPPAGQRREGPELTDEQVQLLRQSIKLEDPYARGRVAEPLYQAAYAAADREGLSDVLERLSQFFTRYHYSAEEISSTAETAESMRDIVADAYTR